MERQRIARMHLASPAMRICNYVSRTFDEKTTPGLRMIYTGNFVTCYREGYAEQWVNINRIELMEPLEPCAEAKCEAGIHPVVQQKHVGLTAEAARSSHSRPRKR